MSAARFEIVRVDDGYFARFVAANNRVVWVTPGLLSRRETAERAMWAIRDAALYHYEGKDYEGRKFSLEVRDVDLRGEGVGAE